MKNTIKRSRIFFYPTGLISLIVLPILCIWMLNKHHAFDTPRILEITYWNPNLYQKNPSVYAKESHPTKKYTTINLTGHEKNDSISLNYAQLQIRALVKSADTTHGVHFHFGEQSKFWTYIKALDLCELEMAKIYIPYQSDIWVLNPIPENSDKPFPPLLECGTSYLMNCLLVEKSDAELSVENEARWRFIIDTVKTYFISGILFILMLFFTTKRF